MVAGIHPVRLKCEYQENPLGVDTTAPRLSWQLDWANSGDRGQIQTAYHILVSSGRETLAADIGDVWDSGKVFSDQSVHVPYSGKNLISRQQCFWKVRVWDRDGVESPWSDPGTWSMGLLKPSDWQGQWITSEAQPEPLAHAAVLMRREFTLKKVPPRAMVYICGLGYYELFINGEKVGDHKLDPAFTDYSKRVFYVSYEVGEYLTVGRNVVGVMLGGGWFHLGTPDGFGFHESPWTAPPKLLLHLDIESPDQTGMTIGSGPEWKWSTGAVTFNCVRGGETIDAREEKPGWNTADYDDSNWSPVAITPAPAGKLESQKIPPIRATQTIRPVKLTEPRPGVYVFDLGVNIVGWVRFETSGDRGREIVLSFNEQLNDDGTVNTRHLISHIKGNGRFQTGRFILRGQGREVYEPRFTYHGFQYVQIEGLSEPPTLDSLTGVWVHTDPVPAGEFVCSDERINRLQQVILRSYLNNLHGIPTDCPHREKMGWMLDGFMTLPMAAFNFDVATFYTKWFQDMIDAQEPAGHVPSIVPTNGWGLTNPDGSPPSYSDPWWGGAILLVPWTLYLHYGDRRILEQGFEAMKKYVDYLGRFSDNLIVRWDLGDWLEPDAPAPNPVRTPVPLTSTAAFFYFAKIVSQAAELLDKKSDFENYAALARNIRNRFNETFLDPDTGLYAKDSQTAPVLALFLHLAPEESRDLILQRLIENVTVTRQGHLSTGFVGTPFLPYALTDGGYADLVYSLITQETGPGWWHMIKNGDTALWETWRGDRDNSFNHPGFGCIGDWFFQALAGIRPDPAFPGFKHFIINPQLVGGLTFVRAGYNSLYGLVSCEWKHNDRHLVMDITVPPNTSATVFIPASQVQDIREKEKQALQAPGVRFLRMEPTRAVFWVDSGKYTFQT